MDNIVSAQSLLLPHYLEEGAAILIDKPLEWTSFDVVNKLRFGIKHHLGVRKFKVGHAGTLDPLASGLLVVCIGKYTKRIDSIVGLEKSYRGRIYIGAETPTYDSESLPTVYYPFKKITNRDLDHLILQFTGKIEQLPPMYSAIKIKGTPLYKLARRGVEIERKSRSIEIFELILQLLKDGQLDIEVVCSKGTYIRTLAYDIGKSLGTGAYLSALRRTKIGDFSVQNAITIDDFLSQLKTLSI